jgi:hypothetical protein
MVLLPPYSRRKRQSEGGGLDVYQYNHIPHPLRVQIIHIFSDAIGDYIESNYGADHNKCYDYLVKVLYKEFGVFKLVDDDPENSREEFFAWIQSEPEIDRLLDGYELGLKLIDGYIRSNNAFPHSVEMSPDDAIAEANARFQEAGIGYQYVSGKIIKVESEIIHREVILPVLALLHDVGHQFLFGVPNTALAISILRAFACCRHITEGVVSNRQSLPPNKFSCL